MRQIILAVRQFVDKQVVPAAPGLDVDHAHPAALLTGLAEIGILGALVDPDYGGLGLDRRTIAMIVEELARGSAALAAIVVAHLTATHAIARFGTAEQRERFLPPMTRGEISSTVALGEGTRAAAAGPDWILEGETPPVDHAARATSVLVAAISPDGAALLAVGPGTSGFVVDPPAATIGLRGVDPCRLRFVQCRVPARDLLGGRSRDANEQRAALLEIARLGVAATGVGLAQAAFEAALRYAQQRTTFGKPIAQHQAVQLALAGMATKITAARLLVYDAATPEADESRRLVAKMFAAETAYEVTLDSMRVHGGYGYTSEFPVERYYRDAACLASTPTTNAADRAELARRLTSPALGARAAVQ
ncbi:MAG TPA: acyl-CoA dehydrogenase family protein [Methylomirabilota bacterium]|nr:acyl-CoA dehydrogenase family protein [Methylomirabilota bacterium]